ncbi:MAG: hypothetical protein MJ053_07620, partial [Elusimicrobiaceae bacterium]|nr:hypothetical protein [Elusimicrobiaceae bacterium]
AQAARRYGLQILFYANKIIGSEYEAAAQTWPVLAWYLVDEPDVARWSRERVIQTQENTHKSFPNHPTALVIGQGKTRVPYYDLADNLMMDWYPVPHLPLTSFGDNVRWAKEGQAALGVAKRPLWGVVQIFNWKEYKQYRPDNDRIGRFPTKEEIRFMSYDGIVNGASGLFYFIFTTEGKPLPTAQPEWWKQVTTVSKELAKLRPVLEKGYQTENPLALPQPLAAKTFTYKKHAYTILLNRSDRSIPVPEELLSKKYKMLFGGPKTAEFPPYGVWVLKTSVQKVSKL